MLISRIIYPKENNYSFRECTISYLGSWIPSRNPKGWYFFSIALIIAGIMDIPLILFLHNHFIEISSWATWIGTVFLMIRAIGMILIAIFPDLEQDFFMDLKMGKIHNVIAGITFASFGLGYLIYGLIALFGERIYPLSTVIYPFIFIVLMILIAVYFLVSWEKKCKKDSTLKHWPGDGWYSFPMWEWILFICHYISIFWLVLNLYYQ